MKKQLLFLVIGMLSSIHIVKSQNVGIGTNTPFQKLEVAGGIRIGNTTTSLPGSMRWNPIKYDFEGFNGTQWVSLTDGKGKWGDKLSYATENSATQIKMTESVIPGYEYGTDMAIAGDWLTVGAFRDGNVGNENIWASGSFHLYQRQPDNTWALKFKRYDPDAKTNDFFGWSIGMTSTHIISGAPYADAPGFAEKGKAYIYTYDVNAVVLQGTLQASDGLELDLFGQGVDMHGDLAVVGAPGKEVTGIDAAGKAYVFTRTGTTWNETSMLTAPDAAASDGFGHQVAIQGDYIAIASPYKTVNGSYNAGKVYVFRKNGSAWNLISQLISPNSSAGENFGQHVSISNNVLLVGAPQNLGSITDANGRMYIFQLSGNTVIYEAMLTASDGLKSDRFGNFGSYYDNTIIVGAPNADIGAASNAGKAYIFRKNSGIWQEEAILANSSREPGAQFGFATLLNGLFAITSAPMADLPTRPDNGQVLFFKQQ